MRKYKMKGIEHETTLFFDEFKRITNKNELA
jgi:hypothetical protein